MEATVRDIKVSEYGIYLSSVTEKYGGYCTGHKSVRIWHLFKQCYGWGWRRL